MPVVKMSMHNKQGAFTGKRGSRCSSSIHQTYLFINRQVVHNKDELMRRAQEDFFYKRRMERGAQAQMKNRYLDQLARSSVLMRSSENMIRNTSQYLSIRSRNKTIAI